ncbi:MAG: hypothetical protein JSS87_00510 [Acidobacteria bacterium]|nr:hypothetical protein [Acidobacteriota bacterium]
MSLKGTLTGTDCWSFKPALMCLFTVAALQLVCQIPGWVSFLLIPLTALGYLILLITILCGAAYCFIKKRARTGASFLLVGVLPVLMWLPINWVADVIHIGLTRGLGVGQLGSPSKSADGKFAIYDWSVGLSISPGIFLVHDASDEIALPVAQHMQPPSSELGFAEECAGKVHHVVGHDYICSF